jgi:hypothetical protein
VGRTYAGILGPTAFLTVLVRGWKSAGGVEATLLAAWLALMVFAAAGYVAGQIAAWIVSESVRKQVQDELDRQEAERPAAKASKVA